MVLFAQTQKKPQAESACGFLLAVKRAAKDRAKLASHCLNASVQAALLASNGVFVGEALVHHAVDSRHASFESSVSCSLVASLNCFDNFFDLGTHA